MKKLGGRWSVWACVGFLGIASTCLADESPKAAAAKPSLTVTVATPQTASLAQKISANGSLAAWQEAIIGAEANGLKINEVLVNVGDRVQRGDVLANLQSDTLRAELAQAEAALAEATASAQEAKAQSDRARSLQQQGFFSSAQLSQTLSADASAQARVQSARALVQLQTVRLSQTQVRAPDAGVISARQATVGSVVGAGTELFRLIRQGRIEWRAEVTAAEIGRIQVGAPAQVKAASGQVLQGKVRMVAPSVDAQTRNAIVYVDLPSATGSARAGMYAQGEIALGQSQALTVPQAAVVVRDGFSYVYTVGADQKVSQLKVQTGRQSGDRVEVTSGLKADARVVASGGAFLNQGDTVRVVDAPAPTPASK
ncbi:efflux RND transporter periplasmic adaptor subunit [Limnohabitans sp. 15K]|uniref:efflux RND transporter periplasmic adaptor subunit n=1 Tax=Limnohabitans sp. 15K TaxID=1100706 RepID=UPI000C1EC14E|nr:efflux RND transporter periplasmic adaptor subunit [Limnohabitans sp. 15K]PIT83536.1 efflux transporter periplasmic adaptor subunit [Limnohabitans sp. 15K]